MHKEIIICLTIVVLIITLDVISKKYTENYVNLINDKLLDFKSELIKDDESQNKAKESINIIMKEWKNRYNVFAFYIDHDELEKVETELTSLSSSIDVEQYSDGVENLDRCVFILNHIKEKYMLKFKNIF